MELHTALNSFFFCNFCCFYFSLVLTFIHIFVSFLIWYLNNHFKFLIRLLLILFYHTFIILATNFLLSAYIFLLLIYFILSYSSINPMKIGCWFTLHSLAQYFLVFRNWLSNIQDSFIFRSRQDLSNCSKYIYSCSFKSVFKLSSTNLMNPLSI